MNKCCECANEEICKEHRGSHRYCFKPKEKTKEERKRIVKTMTDRDKLIELIRQGKDMTPCEKDNDYRCEGIICAGLIPNACCSDCPQRYLGLSTTGCQIELLKNALDLINRLQAKVIKEQNKNSKLRNERNRLQTQNKDLAETVHNLTIEKDALFDKAEELKVEVERLNKEIQITKDAYTMLQTKIEIIKSETVKEFMEKLKENISDDCHIVSDEGDYVGYDCDDVMYCINNLVKEFERKENTAYDD